jgi:hypothetical protein
LTIIICISLEDNSLRCSELKILLSQENTLLKILLSQENTFPGVKFKLDNDTRFSSHTVRKSKYLETC